MKNWKTTIGGAVNGLGKTIRGIPALMVAVNPDCVLDPACMRKYAYFYLAGLIVSALGGFFSDLFAQDSVKETKEPTIPTI